MNINIWVPIICIVFLAVMNIPLWISIVGGSLTYFLFLEQSLPIQVAVQRIVAVTESSSYLAIPFFVTAGAGSVTIAAYLVMGRTMETMSAS